MKKITIVLLILSSYLGSAQYNNIAPWMKELRDKRKSLQLKDPVKFDDIVVAFDEYWKDKDHTKKGSGYKPFKRWQNFWRDNLNEDGTLITSRQLMNAVAQRESSSTKKSDQSDWSSLGPSDYLTRTSNSANLGRLNTITVDPNNPNRYYTGSPAGGLWRSDNAGAFWYPLTDELPQIGISAIAIDPLDSNVIYIATGDDDRGDTQGMGILKSINGGQTWNETGLVTDNITAGLFVSEIALDRSNGANKVFVSSVDGFYKSIDGGTTFTQTLDEEVTDLRLKPGDPNVIYTITSDKLYKSTNNGDSFVQITSGLPNASVRLVIDVTPANPEYVYVLSAKAGNVLQGLYKSTNSGTTFTRTQNDVDILQAGQVFTCMAIAISPTNPDEVYTGVLDVWKSTDGGDSFTQLNRWFDRNESYTHADINFLRFFNGDLYCASDGGFFKSTDGGDSFTDLTVGMEISQFYKVAVSKQNSQRVAGGTQDNSCFGITANGEWNVFSGGDGMDTAINPKDQNHYCGFSQGGGNLYISYDAGLTTPVRISRPTDTSTWITPLDFNSDGELYAVYNALFRVDGDSFTKVSPDFPRTVDELEIDPTNPDNIYVSISRDLYKSTDRGVSFSVIANINSRITAIEVNNDNSNIVYITTSNFRDKVLKSTDGGVNFTSIMGNLPRIGVLDIEHQGNDPDNALFVGTNIGVYRTDDTTSDWEPFDNNLPNTPVTDLEINVLDGNITAATYGRGIWRSSLPQPLPQNDVELLSIEVSDSQIYCSNIPVSVTVVNGGVNTINSVNVSYSINGGTINNFVWFATIGSRGSTIIDLPQLSFELGTNQIQITTTINNDTYQDNNTKSISILNNNVGIGNELNQFETSNDNLLALNAGSTGSLWERGAPTGMLLNAASSGQNVYGTNLAGNYPNNSRSYLVSNCYDLSQIDNPVLKFDMAYDIELNWDFMNIEYSLNNGATWLILGNATDSNWYNSNVIGTGCPNCPGAQWTGLDNTLKEYSYNLTAFSNESNFMFRFNFVSDNQVQKEGVVIDNLVIGGNLLSTEELKSSIGLIVYPNPSKNIFTVQWRNASKVSFKVFDVTGKQILQYDENSFAENTAKIDLSKYSKGMYFLKVTLDTIEENTKLIKN